MTTAELVPSLGERMLDFTIGLLMDKQWHETPDGRMQLQLKGANDALSTADEIRELLDYLNVGKADIDTHPMGPGVSNLTITIGRKDYECKIVPSVAEASRLFDAYDHGWPEPLPAAPASSPEASPLFLLKRLQEAVAPLHFALFNAPGDVAEQQAKALSGLMKDMATTARHYAVTRSESVEDAADQLIKHYYQDQVILKQPGVEEQEITPSFIFYESLVPHANTFTDKLREDAARLQTFDPQSTLERLMGFFKEQPTQKAQLLEAARQFGESNLCPSKEFEQIGKEARKALAAREGRAGAGQPWRDL